MTRGLSHFQSLVSAVRARGSPFGGPNTTHLSATGLTHPGDDFMRQILERHASILRYNVHAMRCDSRYGLGLESRTDAFT